MTMKGRHRRFSGIDGVSGISGISVISGNFGIFGINGVSGNSGLSGISGISGISGNSGISGVARRSVAHHLDERSKLGGGNVNRIFFESPAIRNLGEELLTGDFLEEEE